MITFAEAESRFWQLRSMRSAGQLDQPGYQDALKRLMVQGPDGRWWMPHQETGQWHVFDGASWVPAPPPIAPSPPPPPPAAAWTPPAQASGSVATLAVPASSIAAKASGGSSMGTMIVLALVFWIVVAVAVAIFLAPEGALGVGAAGLLSIFLMVKTYQENWEGTIERIETRRVRVDRGDDDARWENQQFAVIRLSGGKKKELHPMPDWRVGDRLAKRRGESSIRRL